MCTAIKHHSFVGRNLDVYQTYNEEIIITPRDYCIALRKAENLTQHYAIIGMGTVARGYPLYFDAANEHGLYMAGLNYVGNARYHAPKEGYLNLAPYELIPYILAKCRTADEAERELKKINLTAIPFSRELQPAQLHWMIADKEHILTAEPDENGVNIYDNPVGVLSNNPSFPLQLFNLNNYAHLKSNAPINTFLPNIELRGYSEGMGAMGLAGDLSSQSRFVRAVFHNANARGVDNAASFFHLLASVEMPDGSVKVNESYERTEYSSAVDLATLTYYYRAYQSTGLCAMRLFAENLDTSPLIRYPIVCVPPTYQN